MCEKPFNETDIFFIDTNLSTFICWITLWVDITKWTLIAFDIIKLRKLSDFSLDTQVYFNGRVSNHCLIELTAVMPVKTYFIMLSKKTPNIYLKNSCKS